MRVLLKGVVEVRAGLASVLAASPWGSVVWNVMRSGLWSTAWVEVSGAIVGPIEAETSLGGSLPVTNGLEDRADSL